MHAQVLLNGKVVNEKNVAIASVHVLDAQRKLITMTDSFGCFRIVESTLDDRYLLLNHPNYIEDTVRKPLNANSVYVLKEVVSHCDSTDLEAP